MKDRIKKIRKKESLTQQKFADRLGLKRQTIATYETGRSEPMDNIIVSMCREFNINEDWIRYGKGPMYKEIEDKLSTYLGEIAIGNDDFIKEIIEIYMELDQTSKDALKKICKKAADVYNKRKGQK